MASKLIFLTQEPHYIDSPFSLIYLLVWVFSYWKMKKDIEQLNQELKHL
ncbi:DUF3021 family protein [Streptococcus salivarius]